MIRSSPERPVLLLGRSLNIGGTERQMVELAKGLQARGVNVAVALFYSDGVLTPELTAAEVRVVELGKSHRWDVIGFIARLTQCIRQERPSSVYAFLGTANLFALLVRPFCTPFQLVWGVRASNMDLQNYGLFTRITYWLEAKLSRFADLIICNSVAGRSHAVQKGFPADRAVVVPNGIDTDRFRPDPELRARARATWGIGPEEVAVGILARLDPIKDHSTFLRAAQIVIAQVPNARFICIGDGPADYAAELRALGEELGIGRGLIWAGNTNNSVMSLNGLDVLCSSSTGEGFPNSILEGMACGKPCVVTDVGDSRLIIGDAGVSVPPRNPAALAQALVEVLKAGPSVVAGEARARVIAHFSIDRMVEATIGHLRPSLERST